MAGATGQRASKIVYRGDDDNEFFVIANPGMASKWRKDKSIPIVEVLQCEWQQFITAINESI